MYRRLLYPATQTLSDLGSYFIDKPKGEPNTTSLGELIVLGITTIICVWFGIANPLGFQGAQFFFVGVIVYLLGYFMLADEQPTWMMNIAPALGWFAIIAVLRAFLG